MDNGNNNTAQRRSIIGGTAAFVRESLRDSDADYTKGPIRRALGLLAIPMMLEMSMESIFAVVDIAFVSRLGTNAIAAVGLTEALITILYAVAIGLGMGVTAMISRRIGARACIRRCTTPSGRRRRQTHRAAASASTWR